MNSLTIKEIIFYTGTLIAAVAFYMLPFYSEYKIRKKNGELDPKKSFFDNYFNPPIG